MINQNSEMGAVEIEAVDIRLLSIPTVSTLRTARGDGSAAIHRELPSPNRKLVVVRLQAEDGAVGWGECSALNDVGYSHESALSSFHSLTGDRQPHPDKLPMAAAAMEMARLDLRLRRAGQPLASALETKRTLVPAGATLGLMSPEDSVIEAGRLVGDGYRRLKIKIGPGGPDSSGVEVVAALLKMTFPELEIQVDANGSLGEDHLDSLVGLSELGVTAIEQPFPVDRPDLAAMLVARTPVAVVADEAAPDLAAAQELFEQGALSGISIKPPRVGGMSRALELLAWSVGQGVPATAGGMLESALGRHSLAAFAACDGLNLTGDLSPSRRWLAADPWSDLEMSNGMILVPTEPGVAPLPDLDLIEDLTVYHWSGKN